MARGDIDMCCPCERDVARRRRTKHPTVRERIRFDKCGHIAHAINLRWDIWPLVSTCPHGCDDLSTFEFIRTNFASRRAA